MADLACNITLSPPLTINITLNGLGETSTKAVQIAQFAIPLALDVTTYKDWKCTNVSGDTTVSVTGEQDGEAGMIELYNSASAVVTPGTMFTKNAGSGVMATAVSGDNIVAWYKSGSDIIYSISNIG